MDTYRLIIFSSAFGIGLGSSDSLIFTIKMLHPFPYKRKFWLRKKSISLELNPDLWLMKNNQYPTTLYDYPLSSAIIPALHPHVPCRRHKPIHGVALCPFRPQTLVEQVGSEPPDQINLSFMSNQVTFSFSTRRLDSNIMQGVKVYT